ncbi:LysR family transcriptional regulator [Pseudomaricurvus alkylphenolicus]|uniref:LysR family transcriptional regulator n=1 Tax=Pseudomaricurvus alkylphenolicus TaxID=1306991 RepID=UPI00141F0470|nr:LysR family transcriptional regulator [Pseudomaricurvus alkylphenolicus]NIB41741.1 LysR family transcriptional regulator [Pseudomaricurvus alkylphenolicus]
MAIFAETVRLGSFRAAAQSLDLSPSVVSYHISQLEQRLGNALLYRSTRSLKLTHEGEQLFESAEQMLELARTGLAKVQPQADVPSGRLKLALPSVLIRSPWARKVADFAHQYPGIELQISSTDERQNIVQEGVDLAFRIGAMEDSAIKSRRLGNIERKLVCSADYYHRHTPPKTPRDLSDWQWIRLSMLPRERTLKKPGRKPVTVQFVNCVSVNSVELMTQFCRFGLGVATPPDYLVDEAITESELVELLPDWSVDPIPVYAVWPENVSAHSNAMLLLKSLIDKPD